MLVFDFFFFFQAEDGIRDGRVTGVQTCALPITCCCRRALVYDFAAISPWHRCGSAKQSRRPVDETACLAASRHLRTPDWPSRRQRMAGTSAYPGSGAGRDRRNLVPYTVLVLGVWSRP